MIILKIIQHLVTSQYVINTKMLKKLIGLDLYGEAVGINYRGSDVYKTVPGALATLLSLSVLIYYSFHKVS
jgi:hypothetical protein